MEHIMAQNISKFDQIARLLIGSILILSVLLQPATPVWFALLGAYTILTAVLRWEVCYSLALRPRDSLGLNASR